MSKLCLIYNTAPHYRSTIFKAIDREYDCDWYFGETKTDIKEMDISQLKNAQYYKSHGNHSMLYWQGALIPCLFKKKYKNFFVLAETRSVSFWLFLLLKSLFFRNKKVYGWSHGWYGREGDLHKKLDKWRLKVMDGMFVYNTRARNLMVESGVDANKVFTIYNSLDYFKQKELRKKLGKTDIYKAHFGNDNRVLVFIGRLTAVKRLDELFEAVAMLKDKGKEYNIVLIGDGTESERLKKLAEAKNLGVWFYGACYVEEKNAELIYNADLCVAPGNVGLTAMHTMMFGTPVITHNDFAYQMPEFEAIEDGLTGTFFERGNVNSLAQSIEYWFESHKDRNEVRESCFKEIDSRWNPDNQIDIIKKNLKI